MVKIEFISKLSKFNKTLGIRIPKNVIDFYKLENVKVMKIIIETLENTEKVSDSSDISNREIETAALVTHSNADPTSEELS